MTELPARRRGVGAQWGKKHGRVRSGLMASSFGKSLYVQVQVLQETNGVFVCRVSMCIARLYEAFDLF